jgi:hypothetical protein
MFFSVGTNITSSMAIQIVSNVLFYFPQNLLHHSYYNLTTTFTIHNLRSRKLCHLCTLQLTMYQIISLHTLWDLFTACHHHTHLQTIYNQLLHTPLIIASEKFSTSSVHVSQQIDPGLTHSHTLPINHCTLQHVCVLQLTNKLTQVSISIIIISLHSIVQILILHALLKLYRDTPPSYRSSPLPHPTTCTTPLFSSMTSSWIQ